MSCRLVALVYCLLSLVLWSGEAADKRPLPKRSAGTDWSQWRGEHRDGISAETGLLGTWPAEGPPLAWKVGGLGRGF